MIDAAHDPASGALEKRPIGWYHAVALELDKTHR
jgi:hypothetical protein